MWLWQSEMQQLGFRRKSDRYWRCERRFELPGHAHLSIFSWGEQTIPGGRSGPVRYLVELTEFHVTFHIGLEHVHFYYHERRDNEWHPEGHTSVREIRRLGQDPSDLRNMADTIAATFIGALGGMYHARRGGG